MNEQHSFSKAFLKSWSPPAYLLPQLHSVDYAAGYFCLNVCWLKRPGMETVFDRAAPVKGPASAASHKHLHTDKSWELPS